MHTHIAHSIASVAYITHTQTDRVLICVGHCWVNAHTCGGLLSPVHYCGGRKLQVSKRNALAELPRFVLACNEHAPQQCRCGLCRFLNCRFPTALCSGMGRFPDMARAPLTRLITMRTQFMITHVCLRLFLTVASYMRTEHGTLQTQAYTHIVSVIRYWSLLSGCNPLFGCTRVWFAQHNVFEQTTQSVSAGGGGLPKHIVCVCVGWWWWFCPDQSGQRATIRADGHGTSKNANQNYVQHCLYVDIGK